MALNAIDHTILVKGKDHIGISDLEYPRPQQDAHVFLVLAKEAKCLCLFPIQF